MRTFLVLVISLYMMAHHSEIEIRDWPDFILVCLYILGVFIYIYWVVKQDLKELDDE